MRDQILAAPVYRFAVGNPGWENKVSNLDRVRRLVDEAIDGFDEKPTSTSLRRCQRIARIRNDFSALLWLELEAEDVEGVERSAALARRHELVAHLEKEEAEQLLEQIVKTFLARRRMRGSEDSVFGGSVEQLENRIKTFHRQIESFELPSGLHPVDLAHRSDDLTRSKTTLLASAMEMQAVVDRVRAALYRLLIETEQQLDYGQLNAEIFERVRIFVDGCLTELAPDALKQFQAAYRRVEEGDVEALAHALTSCRRILKSVADSVYPSSKRKIKCRDGVERAMTDDRYINRILEFVSNRIGSHGDGAVIQATLDALGQRLTALQGLTSKGVHDAVSAQEVDTCVIQTYLMVGDVLRLKSSQSALPGILAKDPFVVALK